MAIKRSVQLFGDNGAHGTRAHVDESAPTTVPGYGSDNRAVGFNEVFTSGVYNRSTFALALNDDDLDDRLHTFETAGLDGVYRLGTLAEPGGGRVVQADGGAVEAQAKFTAQYGADPLNALLRASAEPATLPGTVGYDFTARGQPAAFGFVDRRALVLTSDRSQIPASATGLGNPGGGLDRISIDSPNFFSASSKTDILTGIDLLQVLAGPYAGIYIIGQVINDTVISVVQLSGDPPSFAPNTAITFRLFRPVFSSSGAFNDANPNYGVTIAALPASRDSADGGALTLVPGGRDGPLSPTSKQGLNYALRTAVRTSGLDPSSKAWGASINAQGGFEAANLSALDPDAALAKSFGWAGYRYAAKAGQSDHAMGFLARGEDVGKRFYGVVVQQQSDVTYSAAFAGTNTLRVQWAGTHVPYGTVGALFEIFAGGLSQGVFRLLNAPYIGVAISDPNATWKVECLDGTLPTFASSGACSVLLLEGTILGRTKSKQVGTLLDVSDTVDVVRSTLTDTVASVEIVAAAGDPDAPGFETYTALRLSGMVNTVEPERSLLIRGSDRNMGDTFVVTASGIVSARVVRAGGVLADGFGYTQTVTFEDLPIPPELMSPQGPLSVPGWYRNGADSAWTIDHPAVSFSDLLIPITNIVPVGAQLSKLKLFYQTFTYPTDQSYILRFMSRAPFSSTATLVAQLVLPPMGTAGTAEVAIPDGHYTYRGSDMLFAYVTNRNLTDTPSTTAQVLVYSAYLSGSLTTLEA
jgi:hypothetical protein